MLLVLAPFTPSFACCGCRGMGMCLCYRHGRCHIVVYAIWQKSMLCFMMPTLTTCSHRSSREVNWMWRRCWCLEVKTKKESEAYVPSMEDKLWLENDGGSCEDADVERISHSGGVWHRSILVEEVVSSCCMRCERTTCSLLRHWDWTTVLVVREEDWNATYEEIMTLNVTCMDQMHMYYHYWTDEKKKKIQEKYLTGCSLWEKTLRQR